ncbi:hypothetical protein POVWA2_038340 [Plasmodium ovale wallikeri]|uniref:Uncharacterized protein n=1 Tax=Plasmodium ovale wallikeri TaxID=864142 RepID=A0A1A8Z5V5_PLAOA|nr:hypothetical protein POVWA1_039600 [Plasmodium ovale wallikeri]SBT39763.1 hypothetical protein POVWA2_038340 [Plasmodium ovale wallikeri]
MGAKRGPFYFMAEEQNGKIKKIKNMAKLHDINKRRCETGGKQMSRRGRISYLDKVHLLLCGAPVVSHYGDVTVVEETMHTRAQTEVGMNEGRGVEARKNVSTSPSTLCDGGCS